MKRIMTSLFILLSGFLLGLAPFAVMAENPHAPKYFSEEKVDVSYVIDGDTFATKQNKRVRLLGINTPEISHGAGQASQPFAQKAKQRLTDLIGGKQIVLSFSEGRTTDKYGRLLAFVHLENGENINETLVKEGLAHVYTFPDTPFDATPLFTAEQQARDAKIGLWSLPRWQVLNAENINEIKDIDSRIGTFNLVQGTVKNIKTVKDKTYLNFGDDWRTDFTVEIDKRFLENFLSGNINPEKNYQNKTLLVRGFLKPVNGILVTATHPQQLQIIK